MLGQFVSSAALRELVRQAARAPNPWLLFDAQRVAEYYNRRPFLIAHRLGQHPAFQLDALRALCRRLPAEQVSWRTGRIPVDADFDTAPQRYRATFTLDDALANLEELAAYVVVNNPERDPYYRPLLEGLLGEVAHQLRVIDPNIYWYSTYLFVSAQGSVTPYHMDREMNFLLQIRGDKHAQLWDPLDDEVMTPVERDQLLVRADLPRPAYHEGLAAKAMHFQLRPGLGLHHPFIAPHVVTTSSGLSISLAFTFRTEWSELRMDAHRMNHRLRQLGLNPASIGRRPYLDATKAHSLRAVRPALRMLRALGPRPRARVRSALGVHGDRDRHARAQRDVARLR